MLKEGLSRGLRLSAFGLVWGIISGLVALIAADGLEEIASLQKNFFMALGLIFPAVIGYKVYTRVEEEIRDGGVIYVDSYDTYMMLLIMGITGSIIGSLLFVAIAGLLPAIFTGESLGLLRQSLTQLLSPGPATFVPVASSLSALLAAVWAVREST